MKNYKLNISASQRRDFMAILIMQNAALLFEHNTDECYFILSSTFNIDQFVKYANTNQIPYKEVSSTHVENKYRFRTDYSVSGDLAIIPLDLH
jgi:hypothetical protein